MATIDSTLLYLRESLSNYVENDLCRRIYKKLVNNRYRSEEEFVNHLDEREIAYLESILKREMNYARNVQDDVRAEQLNDVYELLF